MKILVPIDFSDYSVNAYNYALAIAADINGEIILFHAAHNKLSNNLNSMITVDDILLQESNTELNKLSLSNKNKQIKISTLSKIGLANDLIAVICKEQPVDLIVMGTKGASGINKVLFGSVTSSLIRKCKTPILAVPLKAKYELINNITVALDLKDSYEKSLNLVLQIATKRNVEVEILNVKQQTKSIDKNAILSIEKSFNKVKHSYSFIENSNIIDTLTDFTKRNKTDLLAVIRKKHSFIEQLFRKSVSETLAINISTPLLIIKE